MEEYKRLIVDAVTNCQDLKMVKVIFSFVINYLS